MPTMVSSKQPTIAVITAQYCEKLAVDTMIENKETFVRYTTVGKLVYSHVCLYVWGGGERFLITRFMSINQSHLCPVDLRVN